MKSCGTDQRRTLSDSDQIPHRIDNENIVTDNTVPSITLEISQEIFSELQSVANEMGISLEELAIKVLKRWTKENRVAVGSQRQLCQLK